MTTDEKKKSPSTALAPYKPTPLAIPDASLGSLEEYIRAATVSYTHLTLPTKA